MPCVSENPSKFFPPPYKPDIDGPPFSMLDAAREKLSLLTRDLPDQILHEHLSLLTDSPGYAAFFLTYLHRYERLLDAKPVLIQGAFAPSSTLVLSFSTCARTSVTRMRRGRSMEAPRCCDAPQQDCRARRCAHILEAHRALADPRVARPRLISFLFLLPRSHSGRDTYLPYSGLGS
jgi:hypothetical protein